MRDELLESYRQREVARSFGVEPTPKRGEGVQLDRFDTHEGGKRIYLRPEVPFGGA